MSDFSDDRFPQEWPKHLHQDATVGSFGIAAPHGEPLLDFSRMNSTTFEQFCWWLLRKDNALIGCKRLGRSGTAQHGIDIFAHDREHAEKLSVFECKAWKGFGTSNLTEAIDAFLGGSWAGMARKFTLILAQQDIGETLANRWIAETKRMKQMGIEAELWSAHTLTMKVQLYPDILTKFFPWESVEHRANLWMQRVGFYELVSKAFFDPRERVKEWARDLATQITPVAEIIRREGTAPLNVCRSTQAEPNDSKDGEFPPLIVDGNLRTVQEGGNYWNFKGPWFSLSAILPSGRLTQSSAAITFNKRDMSGLTMTFDHKWLLRSFLSGTDAPLKDIHRGFIVGEMPHDPDTYIIDFPHCRFSLESKGAREIAWVADMLAGVMRNALRSMEAAWSARDFPLVEWAGKKVALAAIDEDLWREIGRFVEKHDVSNGSTHWHMFDGNAQVLKPYHESPTEHFDVGYHGVFYTTKIEGLSYEREVVLMWQPNNLHPERQLSPRGWWPCDFAFKWLTEHLLPEIRRNIYERHFHSRWKEFRYRRSAKQLAAYLNEKFVIRDLRQRALVRDGQWSVGVCEAAIVLQRFFNTPPRPEPYIPQGEIEELYRTAALIARGGRGYLAFARSKLSLRNSPEDHNDLARLIYEHVSEGRVVANSAVVDNVLRAILELLGDSDEWLSATEQEAIKTAMEPFANIRDDALLIERHTRWT
ncbi:hypothetical protein ACOTCG_26940 [Achromobacter xylosoxidans]